MAKRRSTPREDQQRSTTTDRQSVGIIAVSGVVVLAIIILLSSRCTGGEGASSSGSHNIPLVTEPESEEARERREYAEAWGARIDAFNAGFPLEGYGTTFAYAAYDYGIDPRIAPAIARVESGSGDVCFLPYNAWGWGDVSWPDWETAIWGFTRGYSEGYGGDVTMEGAQRYCPGSAELWYEIVTNYMDQI